CGEAEAGCLIVQENFMTVIETLSAGARGGRAGKLANPVATAVEALIDSLHALVVATEFDRVVAKERADVELGDVARVVRIIEADESAGADVRNDRDVLQLRSRGAGAAEHVLLFVLADHGVDIPARTEDAGVNAVEVIATGLVRAEERRRLASNRELRAIRRRRIAKDRQIDDVAGGHREAQLS